MKSVILYGTWQREKHRRYKACIWVGDRNLHIRTEIVDGGCYPAIDDATPRPGEIVLNSLDIPEEETP